MKASESRRALGVASHASLGIRSTRIAGSFTILRTSVEEKFRVLYPNHPHVERRFRFGGDHVDAIPTLNDVGESSLSRSTPHPESLWRNSLTASWAGFWVVADHRTIPHRIDRLRDGGEPRGIGLRRDVELEIIRTAGSTTVCTALASVRIEFV